MTCATLYAIQAAARAAPSAEGIVGAAIVRVAAAERACLFQRMRRRGRGGGEGGEGRRGEDRRAEGAAGAAQEDAQRSQAPEPREMVRSHFEGRYCCLLLPYCHCDCTE